MASDAVAIGLAKGAFWEYVWSIAAGIECGCSALSRCPNAQVAGGLLQCSSSLRVLTVTPQPMHANAASSQNSSRVTATPLHYFLVPTPSSPRPHKTLQWVSEATHIQELPLSPPDVSVPCLGIEGIEGLYNGPEGPAVQRRSCSSPPASMDQPNFD